MEIQILNGIFTKVASPPAVNSPLGSAKMNHVAANSSTLSASSKEPSPAPTPSNLANHNVISFLELCFSVFDWLVLQTFLTRVLVKTSKLHQWYLKGQIF
jgi:hypothetical protein